MGERRELWMREEMMVLYWTYCKYVVIKFKQTLSDDTRWLHDTKTTQQIMKHCSLRREYNIVCDIKLF